jgi:hypothetical protein
MPLFHKIWIEVDVEKDNYGKTKKIMEIMNALSQVSCVRNVSKVQYIYPEENEN